MKDKKMAIGTILLLFAISGICNIVSVSAFTDTIYIPSSSYAYYSLGYLDVGDKLLINEIDSDGGIDVLIMNKDQFDAFKDSGFISSEKMWQDIVYLSGWSFGVSESGDYYYIILWNKALLTGRTVYVDISIDRYVEDTPDIRPIVALITVGVIVGLVISIALPIVLVKRSKKKKIEGETQVQEVIKPKSFYCSNCGAEYIDITSDFCSKCGSKIIR